MKRILTWLFKLLIICICADTALYAQVLPRPAAPTPAAEQQQAAEVIPELSTPRSALDSFFRSMENYASGDEKSLGMAVRVLDLSEIPEFSRAEQGNNLAKRLYSILIRIKIDRSKIPDKDIADDVVIKSDEDGQVILSKDGPNWKFSKATIRNIPELSYILKDEKILRTTAVDNQINFVFLNIRKYIPDILKGQFLSAEYWQLIGIIVALFIAWLVKLSGFYLFRFITNFLVKKTKLLSSINAIDRFVLPLAYIFAAYALHFCLYLLDLDPVIYSSFIRILEIIKIVAIFLLFARAIDLIAEILELHPRQIFGSSDNILIPLIRTTAKFILFFTGLVMVADLFSINVTGLLAGLGIGGLALALAAKDTVENLFGSITVLIDKPFKVGDFISIEGVSGSVENIGLRSTRLRTPENSLLTIPNSKLISVIVDNLGARKFFRTRLSIGVTYETPLEKLQLFCEGIRELLKNHPKARTDYFVHFNEFADSSLNILIQVYFQAASYADYLAKQEDFFINIIKVANHLGVEFAYPVQRHVEDIAGSDAKEPAEEQDKQAFKAFIKQLGQ